LRHPLAPTTPRPFVAPTDLDEALTNVTIASDCNDAIGSRRAVAGALGFVGIVAVICALVVPAATSTVRRPEPSRP
jgi:hypothetical protein